MPDSLLWTQTATPNGRTTHTVLIGYAEATLAGVGADRDATVVGQEVHIATGADASDETVIHADTLYLQAGARYEFPGKRLTIVARRLGMASAATAPATVSMRGLDGAPVASVTPPAMPAPARAPDGPRGKNAGAGAPGANGSRGGTGAVGNPGTDGGVAIVLAFELLPNVNVIFDATGGHGSDGLAGQDGQAGQQGGAGGSSWPSPVNGHVDTYPDGASGRGGSGGDGGQGGDGGRGGTIVLGCVQPVPATAQTQFTGRSGTPGNGGPPGRMGQDGAPTRAGFASGVFGNGALGAPGARGRDGGGTQIVGDEARRGFMQYISSDHIAMIVGRLRFFALTRLTFPTLQSDDSAADADFAALKDTLDWLNADVRATTSGDAWNGVHALLDQLTMQVADRLDSYGNRFDMVPELNPDVSSLAASITALRATEQWYNALLASVTAATLADAQATSALGQIDAQLSARTADMHAPESTIAQLHIDLPAMQGVVNTRMEAMNASFGAELTKIANAMSWSPTGLLSSLGSLCMFAGPEFSLATGAGKAYAGGGALSLASNFDTSQVDAGGSSIDKQYLLSRVRNVEASADALRTAWTASTNGFLTPNGDSQMLLGKRQDFDAFLDQYFPTDGGLRAAVDAYMDAVQQQNALVLQYNGAVARLFQLRADQIASEHAKALALAGAEKLNTPGLLQLSRLAAQAYEAATRDVLRQLYSAGRGYACLALQPSGALDILSALEDPSQLDADVLSSALDELTRELNAFRAEMGSHVVDSTTITLSAGSGASAWMLDSMRSGRQATFFLDPGLAQQFAGHEQLAGKADLRVVAVRAYLLGTGLGVTPIEMVVRGGGRCAVQPIDRNRAPVWFDIPEVTHSNIYVLDAAGTTPTDRSTEHLEPTRMHWGGANGVESLDASLVGFYSAWTVALATDGVPLGGLTEIRLVFDVTYRA